MFKLQRASDRMRIAVQAARFAPCCTLRFSQGTTWGTYLPVILGASKCLTDFIRPRRKISTDFSTQLALWQLQVVNGGEKKAHEESNFLKFLEISV